MLDKFGIYSRNQQWNDCAVFLNDWKKHNDFWQKHEDKMVYNKHPI